MNAKPKTLLILDGPKLRGMRLGQGWSEADLAGKIGSSPADISELEKGKRQAPSSTVRRLAEVFACDPLSFADLEEENE